MVADDLTPVQVVTMNEQEARSRVDRADRRETEHPLTARAVIGHAQPGSSHRVVTLPVGITASRGGRSAKG